MLAIDCSSSHPNPTKLKADGVAVVMRYLTRAAGPKCLTELEAHAYIAAGLGIGPNFEDAADNALRGAGQGHADAVFANDLADQLGIPAGVWVWYSCDTAATVAQVRPYYAAVRAVGRRQSAFYGPLGVGLELVREGLVAGVWVADAAAWSGDRSWAELYDQARAARVHVVQRLDHPLADIAPGAYDLDEILRPFPVWAAHPPASPIMETENMAIIPRRIRSTVPGRQPVVTFDPASRSIVGRNGVQFDDKADPKVWKVANPATSPEGVTGVATLLPVTHGVLELAELGDGAGVAVVALGDSGTFAIDYKNVQPDPLRVAPTVDLTALAHAVAPHLAVTPR